MSDRIPTRDEVITILGHVAQFGIPPLGAARLLDSGTAPFLKFFRSEVLDDFVGHGASTLRFFEGPYGSGKTHLLDLIAEESLEAGYAVVRIDLSAALNLTDWYLLTRRILGDLTYRSAGGDARSVPRILEQLRTQSPPPAGHMLSVPHSGYGRAMDIYHRTPPQSPIARSLLERFLLGEAVTVRDLKAAGVYGVKQRLSLRNAEFVLRTALIGLRRAGVRGVIMCFDESEKTLMRSTMRVYKAANLLRRLIDEAAAGSLSACAIMFAILPGFLQSAAAAYPALGQRILPAHGNGSTGWRTSLVPIIDLSENTSGEQLLEGMISRMLFMARAAGANVNGLRERLWALGAQALKANAGAGVRRDLSRALSVETLRAIE